MEIERELLKIYITGCYIDREHRIFRDELIWKIQNKDVERIIIITSTKNYTIQISTVGESMLGIQCDNNNDVDYLPGAAAIKSK